MTSSWVNTTQAIPSTSASKRTASASPDLWPLGKSTWLGSPVTTMRLFSPIRVKNIFICIEVAFCASSRMMTALESVRPRMKARGAISISLVCRARSDPGVHQVEQSIINRAQVGIHLLAHIARQEAQPLAGFHGGPRENDAIDLLAL